MWYPWFDWHPLDEVTAWSRHCGGPDVERERMPRCQRPVMRLRGAPVQELPPSPEDHALSLLLLREKESPFRYPPVYAHPPPWEPVSSDCLFLKPNPLFRKFHGDLL